MNNHEPLSSSARLRLLACLRVAGVCLTLVVAGCSDDGGGTADAGSDGATDIDGATDPDSDGDGVPNDEDVCPNGTTSNGALGPGCADGCIVGLEPDEAQTVCIDVNECTSGAADCAAHATCANTFGGFTCTCQSGYSGDGRTCEEVDECATGADDCDEVATCTNTPGSFTCACPSTHVGDGRTCTFDSGCSALGCDTNAHCDVAGGTPTCVCNGGYAGDGLDCADIDECAAGQTTCGAEASCTNVPGTYTCTDCFDGFAASADGRSCENIDECLTGAIGYEDCEVAAGGTCTDSEGGYACTACPTGYAVSLDTRACNDVDECAASGVGVTACAVASGGSCTNSLGAFTCTTCPSGYTGAGTNACANIDECAVGAAGHVACKVEEGGVCADNPGSYVCTACPAGAAPSVDQRSCSANELPTKAEIVHSVRRALEYWASNNIPPGNTAFGRGVLHHAITELQHAYPEPLHLQYAYRWATANNWQIGGGVTNRNPDNQAAGQAYVDFYRIDPQDIRIDMVETSLENMLATPTVNDWATASSLHMAMPLFARFAALRDSDAFAARLFEMYEYARTTTGLYSATHHLWWQNTMHIPLASPNGMPQFSSRANGYVLSAIARTLDELDTRAEEDDHRAAYVQMFTDVSAALLPLQRANGFWPANLLDAASPGDVETSGTALIVYGFAWGVNEGILDEATYMPAIARGWNAINAVSLRADGYLQYVQGLGINPTSAVVAASQQDFAVGGLLLAARELLEMAPGPLPATITSRNLALAPGVTITATAAPEPANQPAGLIDNDLTTRWTHVLGPLKTPPTPAESATVDLQTPQTIRAIEVAPSAVRAYRYLVEVSDDNATWTTIVDHTANTQQAGYFSHVLPAPVQGRYVRLSMTGWSGGGANSFSNILELRILD